MSLALFAIHLVNTRKILLKVGILVIAVSFLVQTSGMVLRWIEAGFLEVTAAERAVGHELYGWSWFVVFTQHPPWSNLYEIMVYMSWGIIMVTLFAELKWQLNWVRQMGIMLALMALGMAALTDATIKPLVPALKSWWIMIHVISASIAYAAGSIAAFISMFALMKDSTRVARATLNGCALMGLGVCIGASGGARLITEQTYYVKLLAFAGENIVNVLDMTKENGASFFVAMPYVGYLLLAAFIAHVVVGIMLIVIAPLQKYMVPLFMSCCALTLACFLLILFHDVNKTSIVVDSSVMHHLSPAGPWFVSFKSHPWSFGLLAFVVIIEAMFVIYLLNPRAITTRLPEVSSLESASYRAISLSFFLMTLVLITGALWAHYAWGRYWAWDPKETGALAIWVNYAIYLHARRTPGLSGPASSLISCCGFFVIIIGFLGVNLGLFADGLHTYGNS